MFIFLLLVITGLVGLLCIICFVGFKGLVAETKTVAEEIRKLGVE